MRDEEEIRNVWKYNLEEEIERLAESIEEYPYVSMDTEFPGVIVKPSGVFTTPAIYTYQQIRSNVGLLNLIQLGVSLSNEKGERPKPSTWQFNFYFDREKNMSAQESMHVLEQAEIDFEKLGRDGIHIDTFAEEITTSGLLMNKKIVWVSFHSSYDFGYLISAIRGTDLPHSVEEFTGILTKVFPCFYDIKYLINLLGMKGGLQDLADELKIQRIGTQHQAGSDSLLTLDVFRALREKLLADVETNAKYRCKLFGIEGQ